MGGPFMVEIVFCRVTRRGRKKKAGMNKLARENCRNDGPMGGGFVPPDTLKITLDLSDSGPVFSALDDMMMKMMEDDEKARAGNKGDNSAAKAALKKLLKSGIPGIEAMFGGEDPKPRFGKGGGKKGYHKLTDASKKKFMAAIFGEEGAQIDSSTAAALLAATCSMGNPDVGNKLAELLMPELDEKVDPAMMAALMSACSMIQTGASTEEVLNIMKLELAASGLTEEEILVKAQLLMKAFGKEGDSTAEYMLMSKQMNGALNQAGLPPKDFTAIVLAHKALGACGTSSENIAKVLMIYSVLGKKGANSAHVAGCMKNMGAMTDEARADCKERILKSWNNNKFGKTDVQGAVRAHQALDNENEPGWAEVKNLKDIIGGVSPTSPEAIELNLARAIKAGGLKKEDIGRALLALKACASVGIDSVKLAKIMFLEKTICENGVPASEVARVLSDGMMPPEAIKGLVNSCSSKLDGEICQPADVDASVNMYNNLKLKSNIPTEIIDFVDKTLIQVRCSLEDVADNMISSLCARGEKTARIIGQVCETLKKTGATAHVVASTMMPPLAEMTGECETSLIRVIGRNLKEVEYDVEEVKSAVTELVLKILDNDPPQYHDAVKALEDTLKELGMFSNDIQVYIKENIPSPPTPPEEIARRAAVAAEMARLEAEEEERARMKALKAADPKAYEKEMRLMMAELKESDPEAYAAEMKKNPEFSRLSSLQNEAMGSRRGSGVPGLGTSRSRAGSIVIGTGSRRGSYFEDGTTKRATVAMVTDDPDHKAAMREGLAGAFGDDDASHSTMNGHGSAAGAGAGAGAGGRAGAGSGAGAGASSGAGAGAGAGSGAGGAGAGAGGAGAGAGGAGAGAGGALSKEGQEKLKQLKSSDPAAYEKEMKKLGAAAVANLDPKTQERLQKLKAADPAAYEKELAKLGAAASTGGVAAAAAAAGGAVAPGAAAGAAAVAGGPLDKAKQDQLKKLKDSDPAAYEKEMKRLGAAAVGSLDKATQDRLLKLQKSDPAAYEKELARLGSAAAAGGVQAAAAAAGGAVGPQAAAGLHGGGGGVHGGLCGTALMMDSEMAEKLLAAGMEEKYIRELLSGGGKGISPESRALMEQILASSGSQEELASRVTALLEGTALSGNRGEDTFVGDDGTNLSEARSGNMPKLEEDSLRRPGETVSLAEKIRMRNAAKGARGSVKRQSEIQREKKKSRQEEREEERQRKASYYRKVTGLRRAKVPMMVYSCGGFSRCFRVCRFYDVEGPPVGVEYEPAAGLDTRRELNPDL